MYFSSQCTVFHFLLPAPNFTAPQKNNSALMFPVAGENQEKKAKPLKQRKTEKKECNEVSV